MLLFWIKLASDGSWVAECSPQLPQQGVGYFFSTIINHLQDLYTLTFFILLWLTTQINDTLNYPLSLSPAERASWSVLRGEQKWPSVFFSQGKHQSNNNMITPRYRKAHLEGRKTRNGTAILIFPFYHSASPQGLMGMEACN